MINWLLAPEKTRRNAYIEIAENTGMSPFAVEKDWWVVQTLATIFEMDVAKYLLFKGGTSLSKAWKLIERFSEDIDLALDREFFGFTGELSKNQRDKIKKTSGKYIDEVFFPELKGRFQERGFSDLTLELEVEAASDRDRKINLYYPYVIESPGYLQPKVQLEIGSRSLKEPYTVKTFCSLVDERYPNREFTLAPVNIPTVNPERTFLEKIFLLHEEFQRPTQKRRVERLSRHIYDVVKLSRTEFAEKALIDPELYTTILKHRQKFTRVGGVNYNLHQPQSINPLPTVEAMDAWKKDYSTMLEQMIYEENPPSFEQLMDEMNSIKFKINNLPWKIEVKFPLPNF